MTASNRRPFKVAGLYAITPDLADTELLCQMVEASILGGARIVQYRNKVADDKLRLQQASALLDICRKNQVRLIINDHVELCLVINADGVHIGGDDGNIAAIKHIIGEDKLLGVSCYGEFARAEAAEKAGADYVAFGACFASNTKPNAPRAELSLFNQVKPLNIPSVAIGGITLQNAHLAKQAGADAIAVIGELFNQAHDKATAAKIKATAEQFSSIF
jgi:thiamine-phosphate pyrophosphorylase